MRKRIYAVFAALLLCVLMVGVVSAEDPIQGSELEQPASLSGINIVISVSINVFQPNGQNMICSSLQDAIDQAQSGATIQPTKDLDLTTGISVRGKSITLDLNGNTLAFPGVTDPAITVGSTTEAQAATLVILDNKTNGKISAPNGYGILVGQKSFLEIQEGTVEAKYFAISGNANGNYPYPTVKVTEGVKLISTEDTALYFPAEGGVVTIEGATIEGVLGGVCVASGDVTITDTTITVAGQSEPRWTDKDGSADDGSAIVVQKKSAAYTGDLNLKLLGTTVVNGPTADALHNYIREDPLDPDTTTVTIADTVVFNGNLRSYQYDQAEAAIGGIFQDESGKLLLYPGLNMTGVGWTGTDDSYAVTISEPGTYCVTGDWSTSADKAMSIEANDVVIEGNWYNVTQTGSYYKDVFVYIPNPDTRNFVLKNFTAIKNYPIIVSGASTLTGHIVENVNLIDSTGMAGFNSNGGTAVFGLIWGQSDRGTLGSVYTISDNTVRNVSFLHEASGSSSSYAYVLAAEQFWNSGASIEICNNVIEDITLEKDYGYLVYANAPVSSSGDSIVTIQENEISNVTNSVGCIRGAIFVNDCWKLDISNNVIKDISITSQDSYAEDIRGMYIYGNRVATSESTIDGNIIENVSNAVPGLSIAQGIHMAPSAGTLTITNNEITNVSSECGSASGLDARNFGKTNYTIQDNTIEKIVSDTGVSRTVPYTAPYGMFVWGSAQVVNNTIIDVYSSGISGSATVNNSTGIIFSSGNYEDGSGNLNLNVIGNTFSDTRDANAFTAILIQNDDGNSHTKPGKICEISGNIFSGDIRDTGLKVDTTYWSADSEAAGIYNNDFSVGIPVAKVLKSNDLSQFRWNITPTEDTNIIGGTHIAGNWWGTASANLVTETGYTEFADAAAALAAGFPVADLAPLTLTGTKPVLPETVTTDNGKLVIGDTGSAQFDDTTKKATLEDASTGLKLVIAYDTDVVKGEGTITGTPDSAILSYNSGGSADIFSGFSVSVPGNKAGDIANNLPVTSSEIDDSKKQSLEEKGYKVTQMLTVAADAEFRGAIDGQKVVITFSASESAVAALGGPQKVCIIHMKDDGTIKEINSNFRYELKDGIYTFTVTSEEGFSSYGLVSKIDGGYTYQLDRSYLFNDGTGFGVLEGTAIVLPVNYAPNETGTFGTANTWNVDVLVTNLSDGTTVDDLTYTFESSASLDSKYADSNDANNYQAIAAAGDGVDDPVSDLFNVTITGNNLKTGEKYNVKLTITTAVSVSGPASPSQVNIVDLDVSIHPWVRAVESNIYNNTKDGETASTVTNPWNFDNKAQITYTVSPAYNGKTRTYTSSVPDLFVKRNDTADYGLSLTGSCSPVILKYVLTTDGIAYTESPAAAGTTITKSGDNLQMTVVAADMDAEYFVITFTGNKVGDVANIASMPDTVNVIDVDYILHQNVAEPLGTDYIYSPWKVYADITKDGKIAPSDATAAFYYGLNRLPDEQKKSAEMTKTITP